MPRQPATASKYLVKGTDTYRSRCFVLGEQKAEQDLHARKCTTGAWVTLASARRDERPSLSLLLVFVHIRS